MNWLPRLPCAEHFSCIYCIRHSESQASLPILLPLSSWICHPMISQVWDSAIWLTDSLTSGHHNHDSAQVDHSQGQCQQSCVSSRGMHPSPSQASWSHQTCSLVPWTSPTAVASSQSMLGSVRISGCGCHIWIFDVGASICHHIISHCSATTLRVAWCLPCLGPTVAGSRFSAFPSMASATSRYGVHTSGRWTCRGMCIWDPSRHSGWESS